MNQFALFMIFPNTFCAFCDSSNISHLYFSGHQPGSSQHHERFLSETFQPRTIAKPPEAGWFRFRGWILFFCDLFLQVGFGLVWGGVQDYGDFVYEEALRVAEEVFVAQVAPLSVGGQGAFVAVEAADHLHQL